MIGFLSGDHGCLRGKHEVDTRIRHQVGLELGDIHVQSTIESEGGGQG